MSNEPVKNDRSLQVKRSEVRGQGSEVQEFTLELPRNDQKTSVLTIYRYQNQNLVL